MATDPSFAATPNPAAAIVPATADTSMTAPTNVATVLTAGANGSRVEQVRCTQLVTTASTCVVNLFLYDGATYHYLDSFTFTAFTVSTTAVNTPLDKFFTNLALKSGWSLRATVTTAAGQSAFKVLAFGADF